MLMPISLLLRKRLGEKTCIKLTFGAPTYRASNSPNTQEVYDIMGKDYNLIGMARRRKKKF